MRRINRRPRTNHGRRGNPLGSLLLAPLIAGLSLSQASAQQNSAPAAPAPKFRVAPPLAQAPASLVDPTRVLVTLKTGENRESLRQEATRRQLESSDGAMTAVIAAIEAASTGDDRSLVLDLPSPDREQDGRPVEPGVPANPDDFTASLSPQAARLVGALRQMPQVEAVEPNRLFFANQGSAADSINAILGVGPPAQTNSLRPAASSKRPDWAVTSPGQRQGPVAVTPPKLSDDPFAVFQWHLSNYAPQASASGLPGGTGFLSFRATRRQTNAVAPIVAIVDTGLIPSHEDLATSRIVPGYDFISFPTVANDGDGRDGNPTDVGNGSPAGLCGTGSVAVENSWHGSHVAGIAGAVESDNRIGISLPAIPVRIMPLRVIGRCGGLESDIIDAMRWAAGLSVAGVPGNPNPAKVINLSLGGAGPCSTAYQTAVDAVSATGAIIVVAAGNSGEDARQFTPASCTGVITVAASDTRGFITPYSNFGPRIDLLAPGGDTARDDDGNGLADGILSLVSGDYELKQGTSMAAPLVAAAVAALVADRPDMTVEEVRRVLAASALPRSITECPKGCGAGLLQIAPSAGIAASSIARSSP